jgi:hypothetical protein
VIVGAVALDGDNVSEMLSGTVPLASTAGTLQTNTEGERSVRSEARKETSDALGGDRVARR